MQRKSGQLASSQTFKKWFMLFSFTRKGQNTVEWAGTFVISTFFFLACWGISQNVMPAAYNTVKGNTEAYFDEEEPEAYAPPAAAADSPAPAPAPAPAADSPSPAPAPAPAPAPTPSPSPTPAPSPGKGKGH